ncbi:arginase [Agrobacterium larrymoorei]|uniref:Arginase n=1 Tax=Agrobacterium larrymoorei TaxID=160699 RepID=A0A4D7DU33_9HYPH|nr:arginase [Agrobacterium larrymoorei]QCJ00734.1 arginase [Agrobacterium larrymoorei]QYA10737.1 arginase [Agrobacterium larrymoorei]
MQLMLLHLDDALELQPDFLGAAMMAGAREIADKECGQLLRLWSRKDALCHLNRGLVRSASDRKARPRLCFMGSGDFHHVTALLLDDALESFQGSVTVIHIDNHPDWVHFADGLHCGSWVNAAVSNPQVDKVITLGVCSSDLVSPESKGANLDLLRSGKLELYPYQHPPSKVRSAVGRGASYSQVEGHLHWSTISDLGESNFLDRLLETIQTAAVYITIDKDSLVLADAVTNWDQGGLSLPYVLWLIHEIGTRHHIVGADVTGDYSEPRYGGTPWTRLMKKAEIFIDQPFHLRNRETTRNINSAANHALLEVFSEVMA